MGRTSRPDLAVFNELNDSERASGVKTPWKLRYELIKEHFPIAERIDWRKAFQDLDLYGRLIRDILENDQKANAKGPRSGFNQEEARARFRQFAGDDYTQLPFVEAFRILAGPRSIRHLQYKLNMKRNSVWKLKAGIKEPDLYTIEQVAKAFNKDPSYFVEYRVAVILGALGDQMSMAPEMTVDLYRRIQRKSVSK